MALVNENTPVLDICMSIRIKSVGDVIDFLSTSKALWMSRIGMAVKGLLQTSEVTAPRIINRVVLEVTYILT